MKISVVITCYNLERYVGLALDSVLHQEPGDYELEVVVVDDASTDASVAEIARRPGVRLVRNPSNLGVLLATLEGLRHSTGEVVCFLDGDDLWLPGKLRQVAARFAGDPELVFLTHNYQYIGSDGEPLASADRSQDRLLSLKDPGEVSALLRRGILVDPGYVWLGSAYCLRRSALDLAGFADWVARLPEPQFTYQDWPLAYWFACSASGSFGYLKEPLFQYRLHQANYSGDAATLEKMQRNLRKSHNTHLALLDLAGRVFPEPSRALSCRNKARYTTYLVDLYGGRRLTALGTLLQSLPYLAGRGLALKELVRCLGVLSLGPRLFLRLTK